MEVAMNFPFPLVLDELAYEYECMTGDSNPPKLCVALDKPDEEGWLRKYLNIMSAVLSDGSFGSKTIFVDEVAGTTGGDVLHYSKARRRLHSLPASLVTPRHCAMMAALTLEYRRQGPADGRRVLVLGRWLACALAALTALRVAGCRGPSRSCEIKTGPLFLSALGVGMGGP